MAVSLDTIDERRTSSASIIAAYGHIRLLIDIFFPIKAFVLPSNEVLLKAHFYSCSGETLKVARLSISIVVVALVTLIIFAGWTFFTNENRSLSWNSILVFVVIFAVGLFFLSASLFRARLPRP